MEAYTKQHAISNPDLLNEIPTLSRGFRDIEKRAAELHAGTCTLRDCQPQQQSGDTRLVTARNQVLLEVLLDALKTIFEILVKCAAWLDQQRGQKQYDTKQLSGRHEELVKKACDLLDTAKDRLIAEADDIIHDKGLGPVVTPEAIVIMLLDRLSRGVYEDGTADVMDLYEKIVDTIVSELEPTKYFLLIPKGVTSRNEVQPALAAENRPVTGRARHHKQSPPGAEIRHSEFPQFA